MRERREWDENKVRNTFNRADAEAILAVNIPQRSTSDRVAWIHSNNGQYSVKSGYHYWHSSNISDVGSLKLNVDASVFEGADSFSVGMVLRNHQGLFFHGRTMRFAGKVEVIEAELTGILEALKWASDLQGHMICVESDSLLSVQAIKRKDQNQLEAGMVIEQCRDILSSREDIRLGFVKKQANRVAHLLARLPCTLNSFIEFSSPPVCVLETLMSDG